MKGLLVKHFQPNAESMIHSALGSLSIQRPERLLLRAEEDSTAQVERLGDYFSQCLCAVEALWDLINAGILIPASSSIAGIGTTIQITQSSGGSASSGGEDFGPIVQMLPFPHSVMKTRRETQGFILSDPDLYLASLPSQSLPPDTVEALRECIRCFRSELFLACAVMLGKASEGIWIELGKSLYGASSVADQAKDGKFRADLENHVKPSFASKLREIQKYYEAGHAKFPRVTEAAKSAGVGLDEFRLAFQWAEMVRDSRNVIHYGSQPTIPNNYTNVATLLLAGSTHLRNILVIHEAALAHPGG